MQRLAHGAELRLEACGLGAGDAERSGGLPRIELAQSGPLRRAAPKAPSVPVACQPRA